MSFAGLELVRRFIRRLHFRGTPRGVERALRRSDFGAGSAVNVGTRDADRGRPAGMAGVLPGKRSAGGPDTVRAFPAAELAQHPGTLASRIRCRRRPSAA